MTTHSPHEAAELMNALNNDILHIMEKHSDLMPPQMMALVLADVYAEFSVFLAIDREAVTTLVGRLYDAASTAHTHHMHHTSH